MKPVLLAPAAFKGTFSSPFICALLSRELRRQGIPTESFPLADGGDGTLDAFHVLFPSRFRSFLVTGPDGRRVRARILISGKRWFLEMAEAAGLGLMRRPDPWTSTTFGVGEILRRAAGREIILGIGGSATNDGGAGMLQALGARLLDRNGGPIPPGGGGLGWLHRIEWDRRPRLDLTALTDVDNVLLGRNGATYTYGPQKGATKRMLPKLEANLRRFSKIVRRDLGVRLDRIPGGGAAGGLGAALIGILRARRRRGADYILRESGIIARSQSAAAVVTGEGRIDATTFQGKAVGEILRRARCPVFVLAGSSTLPLPRAVLTGDPSRKALVRAAKILAARIASNLRGANPSM